MHGRALYNSPAMKTALAVLLTLAAAQAPSPSAAPSPTGSKIWIGRAAEFEEYLRTATIGHHARHPAGG